MSAPLRIGVLGAAGITPAALIEPATQTPGVEIVAVAARDTGRATAFAAEHGIATVHATYAALLADPAVDAVYIPLPNSEHGRWTVAAVDAGKHVLVEKPFAANLDEAREVAAHVDASDRVVMEAIHSRYHRLVTLTKDLIESGAIGAVTHLDVRFDISMPDRSNIRYRQDLAGGASMDLGIYCVFLVRALVGEEPTVVSAVARPADDPRLDEALAASLVFPSGVTATVTSSLLEDVERQTAVVTGTRGRIEINDFVHPQRGGSVTCVTDGAATRHDLTTAPSSYREQLSAFLAAVRDGGEVLTDTFNAVAQQRVIDAMYLAAGLQPRTAG